MNVLIAGSGAKDKEYIEKKFEKKKLNIVLLDFDPNVSPTPTIVWDLNKLPLPFSDCEFDFVLARHILEHVQDIVGLMREFKRVLKPNGKIEISCPFANSFGAWSDPTHVHFFLPESFIEYFCVNGSFRRVGKTFFVLESVIVKKNRFFVFLPSSVLKFVTNGLLEFTIVLKVG